MVLLTSQRLGTGNVAKVRCTALEGGAKSKKVFTAPAALPAADDAAVAAATAVSSGGGGAAAAGGAGLATTVAGGFAYVSGAVGTKDGASTIHAGRSTGVAPRGLLHEGRSTEFAPQGCRRSFFILTCAQH